MRKLSTEKRAMILSALVEGNSVNSTARLCGCSKITVLRLLADAGTFCEQYHDLMVDGLTPKRIQLDEIWAFCGCKDRTKKDGGQGHGSVWTWVGLDADSKLCISYLVGTRDGEVANMFVQDVKSRITTRVQLSTDGYKPYLDAVDDAFGGDVDYAMINKLYRADRISEARYSPPSCIGCKVEDVCGEPDPQHISTSFVERQNLSMRMSMRRFTRLTNAFSKKLANHCHAVSLHYFHYNFVRKHKTLKTTPAVAAGIANKRLTMLDLVVMIEEEEKRLGGRLTDYLPAVVKKSDSE